MTEAFKFSHEFLELCSNEIINKVAGINRVCYDLTSKPPGTIEFEWKIIQRFFFMWWKFLIIK